MNIKWVFNNICRVIVFILVLSNFGIISATTDSSRIYKTILDVGHYNSDSVQDTLIGAADVSRNFILREIKWGKDTSYHEIPESLKVAKTIFLYQCDITSSHTWSSFTSAITLDRMNGDTLKDIVFFLGGQIPITDTTFKDTATAFIIFGQKGLDTIPIIDCSAIDTFQTSPFIAMHIRIGKELTDKKVRDLSYIASYKFNDVNLDLGSPGGHRPGKDDPNAVLEQQAGEIRLYPNPAVYYSNLELNNFSPGTYRAGIFTSEGKLINEDKIIVREKGSIINTIDFTRVATGSYIIRIDSEGKFIGAYQIIVIH